MPGMRLRTAEREALENGNVMHTLGNYNRPLHGYTVNPDGTVVSINENPFEKIKELYEDYKKGCD